MIAPVRTPAMILLTQSFLIGRLRTIGTDLRLLRVLIFLRFMLFSITMIDTALISIAVNIASITLN